MLLHYPPFIIHLCIQRVEKCIKNNLLSLSRSDRKASHVDDEDERRRKNQTRIRQPKWLFFLLQIQKDFLPGIKGDEFCVNIIIIENNTDTDTRV